ncbi:MAG TPA: site-specific integrase [Acidimicrobiales bacterium]|nr:site-specific integrase [Acidimicrobiales bacterium]
MSIHKRETQRRAVVYDVRLRSPTGRVITKTFPTRKQADAFEREQLRSRDRGEWIDPESGRMTFGEWAEEWQRTIVHLRPSTRRIHEGHLRSHILPALGGVPLNKLTPSMLRGWLSELSASTGSRGKPLAPAYVHQAYRTLRQVLGAAVLDQRLGRNPLAGVKPPRPDSPEMRTISADDVASLADTIDPRFRAFVITAAWCGLRVSEVFALRWDRIDLLRRTVTVVEQIEREGKRGFVSRQPKTAAGRRTIHVPMIVADALEQHLSSGFGGAGKHGLVFVATNGEPVDAHNFRARIWQPAVRRAGLEPLRIHDLRHTCASLAIAAGADVLSLQRMLGHATPAITLNRYAHLMPGRAEAVADRLDELARTTHATRLAQVVDISDAR